ncbi:MAG: hypothetical protein RL545_997 [Actinomycetota bacterium]
MNLKAYSPTRILGALRRRGLAYVRKLQYQPGKLPIQKGVVLFDSFNGKVIGDNPLDIFLELQKVRPDLKFYWTIGSHTKAPAGATGVRFESKQWLDLLATAEYIVANTSLPTARRKPGTTSSARARFVPKFCRGHSGTAVKFWKLAIRAMTGSQLTPQPIVKRFANR